MSIVADYRIDTHASITGRSVNDASNRILDRQLFDNQRLQREQRHHFRNIAELIAGEGDDPAFLSLHQRQLREVAQDLIHLKAQAQLLSAKIDRRRRLGGVR